ncbi:Checkpoint protein HUS1 [Fasciola hepatica]|uniref:Checkpoint protein n=1 Tax=Fasciola hepatica TaxID=6192 RepID=A0A4E0RVB7_FASHE|nr:Checkpoint protein HUS1 [Fasciola hepatica]
MFSSSPIQSVRLPWRFPPSRCIRCFNTSVFSIILMKFRIRTNDTGCIEHFSNVIHMIAGLTKNAIFRLTKENLQFVIKERVVYGGVSAWCEIDHVALFPERTCEGISAQQDEIFLEVVLDQLTHCLRSGSALSSGSSGTSFATSVSALAAASGSGVAGSTSMVGYTTFGQGHGSCPAVHGLKVKLVRRCTPCLAIELEQASITGRSRAVWHFIPVHVVPPRLWDEFLEPPDPDFDVSIFFPSIRTLRPFVDRMKKFAKFLLISANGVGELKLGIDVETLARVRLHFRGLRARSWLPSVAPSPENHVDDDDLDLGCHAPMRDAHADDEPRSAVWSETGLGRARSVRGRLSDADDALDLDQVDEGELDPPDRRFVSVSLDIRRVGQLLASPRTNASWFVCNIIHEKLAQFVLLFDSCKLKYNIPASTL